MTSDAGRFFRSYNRTIAVAYPLLLLGLAGFFAFQLRENMRQEVAFIQEQVERHHQFLEFVLRSSLDQVETLRMAAGRPTTSEAPPPGPCAPRLGAVAAAGLREEGDGFQRDGLSDRDAGGNVVGQGRLRGRADSFYCDLRAALALDAHLASMAFHLPHAARTRFVSSQSFQLVAPWRPARELPFSPDLYQEAFWTLGSPQANPDRLKYWPPVYFGGPEVGLLAPVAAPVYDRDRFMGVLALDMSLDYLHRVNGSFSYPLGQVAIIDGSGKVLAHPGIYVDPLAVRAPAGLAQLFGANVVGSMEALLTLPQNEAVERGGTVLLRRSFSAAPWQLVYSVPREALWRKLLSERGPLLLSVLGGLALLMALTYVVTRREFVGPAAQLVEHLVAQTRFEPLPMPRVPAAWRPWFESITDAFRKTQELGVLRGELDIASRLQQSILPHHWPADARFSLWGSAAAAREVGGDFYDHFEMADGRRAMVVADVSGKGIGPGLFAMVSKTLLRSVATLRQAGPGEVAAHVNQGLCADNDSCLFVTAFHGQYDPSDARLVYVNAGHPPPLLVRAQGSAEWLGATGGTAFGVLEEAEYAERELQLAPGDTVLIYSDGVTEADNREGEQFGLERLRILFDQRPSANAREAVERVLRAVAEFAEGAEQADDITCIALRCNGNGGQA